MHTQHAYSGTDNRYKRTFLTEGFTLQTRQTDLKRDLKVFPLLSYKRFWSHIWNKKHLFRYKKCQRQIDIPLHYKGWAQNLWVNAGSIQPGKIGILMTFRNESGVAFLMYHGELRGTRSQRNFPYKNKNIFKFRLNSGINKLMLSICTILYYASIIISSSLSA